MARFDSSVAEAVGEDPGQLRPRLRRRRPVEVEAYHRVPRDGRGPDRRAIGVPSDDQERAARRCLAGQVAIDVGRRAET